MDKDETKDGEGNEKNSVDGAFLLPGPEDAEKRERAKRKRRKTTRRNLQFIFNGILTVTTVALMFVAGYQAYISTRSADAARSAAETAKAALDSNTDSIADTMIEMKSQSRAMHRSALASAATAKAMAQQANHTQEATD